MPLEYTRSPDVMVAEAVSRDANSNVMVTVIGEATEMSGESSSRTDIIVPVPQKKHVHRPGMSHG